MPRLYDMTWLPIRGSSVPAVANLRHLALQSEVLERLPSWDRRPPDRRLSVRGSWPGTMPSTGVMIRGAFPRAGGRYGPRV
jgi:hypothetical protein